MLVPEVEVISGGVVEVDRALDQSQAENTGVEIEISLRVACYAGDVMYAGSPETHCRG
jgi:hypothetical protein